MYLKRIEIQGFKSFAEKVDVEFQGGVTGVVGPNGSGKSNISDAIRWVLGEQSVKSLRGSKMEDVIFSGTEKRKPLGFAEVTLVLDNKKGQLNIDYSEVSVTRRVFRSGDSEYYINKNSCRLKDIRELFMDTGVGKDGYSIIGQGKIDEILSTKSDDRRNLFEEAAGIVKHKSRKEEAEKKLEKTNDNLLRLKDIINELEGQLEPLMEQSKKAKEFKGLSCKLKDLEVNLYIREIDRLKEQVNHLDSQKALVTKQLQYNEEKRDKLEEKYQVVKTEIDKMDENIDRIQNLKYNIQSKLEVNEGDLKLYNEKKLIINRDLERLSNEIIGLDDKIKNLKIEKEKVKKYKLEIESSVKDYDTLIQNKDKELQSINKILEEKERNIDKKKSDVIETLNGITDKKSKIKSLLSFNQNIEKRISQINKEIEILEEEKSNNSKNISSSEEELVEIRNNLTSLNTLKDEEEKIKKNYESKLEEIFEKINDIKGEIQGKLSNYKLLKEMKDDYEGYFKSVKNTLLAIKNNNSLGNGVRGTIAELIKVDKKFEKAIEIALGSSLQNIVTDTQSDAKRIIDHLKKYKLGRVTFLPMDSISGRSVNNSEAKVLEVRGVFGIASKLIKYDNVYSDIFNNLLGRVIIVDNIDTGIKVSNLSKHSLKIVSLDGDVLNPGGSMTGGSFKNNGNSLLGRERQIEELNQEIVLLKENLTFSQKNGQSKKEELIKITSKLEETKEKANGLNVKLARLENNNNQYFNEKIRITNALNKYKEEILQLTKEKEETEEYIKEIEKEINNLKNENQLTQKDVDELMKIFEEEKTKKDKLIDDLTNIKVKAASHKQEVKGTLDSLDKLEKDISNIQDDILLRKEQYKEKESSLDEVKSRFSELQLNKEELTDKLVVYEKEHKDLKVDRNNFMETFYSEQEKLKDMNRKISDLQKSINTLDLKYAKYNMQLDGYVNKLWDDYEMSYQMALELKREIENITKVQNDIRLLKKDIKDLGNVNVEAIDEYERVKERYEFLQGQKNDLIEAKDSLNKVIKDLEVKMRQQFMENFEIIRGYFNQVFIKLFGGGKADVYLVDPDNVLTSGIEIVAQPPGKKLQSLSLLSGGERALTAIALLFAILKTKPTPFCILDEIEAALDDANVYRYAEYLKEFSQNTQFIVITHRKGTMESVDSLYGVTMEEKGVSRLISVKLTDKLIEKVS